MSKFLQAVAKLTIFLLPERPLQVLQRPLMATVLILAPVMSQAGDKPEQFIIWGWKAAPDKYLGEPGETLPTALSPPPTKQEKSCGLAVLSGPAFAVVTPGATLARCSGLTAADCPREYGPLAFAIHAIKGGEYAVVSGDLTGPGGQVIPASWLDVRVVRPVGVPKDGKTETVPLLLESFDRVRIPDGVRRQCWITYRIPEDAAPGDYAGKLRIICDGKEKLVLPLTITVYPFKLADSDINFYIYAEDPAEPASLTRWLTDQRLHGMNLGMVSVPVTREGELIVADLRVKLDAYAKAGLPRRRIRIDLWNRITAEWLNDPDKTIGMWGPWFRYYPFSGKLDRRFVEAVKTIRDECRARGYEPIIGVGDETGSHDWTIPAVKHYNELLKREVPDVVRELTVGGGWAGGVPEHEHFKGLVNVWTTNRWLPDKLEIVRRDDSKAVIQLYNMGGAGSGPGGVLAARALYGYYAWKAGVGGVAQWVYNHSSTPEHNYAWPACASRAGASPASLDSGGGTVPTIRWEAVREGVKDRRYIATLEAMLAGRKGPAADAARVYLDSIAAKIELKHEDYDPVSGGRVPAASAAAYEEWRAGIADYIVRLSSK
jgi:hypothetical protein